MCGDERCALEATGVGTIDHCLAHRLEGTHRFGIHHGRHHQGNFDGILIVIERRGFVHLNEAGVG